MNNLYNNISVPPNISTVIASLTVPIRSGYSLKGLIVWVDVDAEISIKVNLNTIGGGRINGAVQTLLLNFESSPYGLSALDTVLVFATHAGSVNHDFKSTLLFEQL